MAFHVACPITCRRICYCELGFPAELKGGRARGEFFAQIEALQEFLRDPWTVRVDGGAAAAAATVQVLVPKVVPPPPPAAGDGEEARRVAVKRQAAAAASLAAESFARRLEVLDAAAEVPGQAACHMAGEDQSLSTVKVMCRICFSGENEDSERAVKMLSCISCDKKYHRSCLKSWAEYRDLFHWSSWVCPSCRICEVCRRTGDANKLMFCKRCDGAYHCYCQQPPHKNVSRGPYLCPKHTRCHSCGSTVPGSGPSTRWFLGYTCCDACGRLFVKGNYCPVCLKVYRDSETTPMVCCDVCERWVHCSCDGISDEKYQQFQVDQTLEYTCAACRGDCCQVKDISDAVRELWQRRDTADRDQIASLRAAAGLPSQEAVFSLSPHSDDEQNGPIIQKNDVKKPLKLSVKGISDKLTNNSNDNGKGISRVNQLGSNNCNVIEEAAEHNADLVPKIKIKGSKLQNFHLQNCASNILSKRETVKGTKLVIHIGSRNRTVSGSPKSETSNCHKYQDIDSSYRSGIIGQQKTKDSKKHMLSDDHVLSVRLDDGKGAQLDDMNQMQNSKHRIKEKNVIKLGKVSDMHQKNNGNIADESQVTCSSPLVIRKRNEEVARTAEAAGEATMSDGVLPKKQSVGTHVYLRKDKNDTSSVQLASKFSSDSKPLLKLKFKNPYFEQRSSWAPQGEEENSVKGQRSKRKRPSAEKVGGWEDASYGQQHQETPVDEAMDADWILRKLGKSAIGKRVEVYQSSDNSWQQGVISNVFEGTSSLSVRLDDGRSTTLELGKQGVRFISQKQQRAKT